MAAKQRSVVRKVLVALIVICVIQMAGVYGWFSSPAPLIGVSHATNDNGNSGGNGNGNDNGGGNSGGGNSGGGDSGGGNSGGGNSGGGNSGSGVDNGGGNSGGSNSNAQGSQGSSQTKDTGGKGGTAPASSNSKQGSDVKGNENSKGTNGQSGGSGNNGEKGNSGENSKGDGNLASSGAQNNPQAGSRGSGSNVLSSGQITLEVAGVSLGKTAGTITEVRVDRAAAEKSGGQVRIEKDTIIVDKQTHSITISTMGTGLQQGDVISAPVADIRLESAPVSAQISNGATASFSFSSSLNAIPQNSQITSSIIEIPEQSTRDKFENALSEKGLAINEIAYTVKVDKANIQDISDIGETTVVMSALPAWVNSYGGPDKVSIARVADDGSSQVLETNYVGIDASGNMQFEGISPNGLSIFALITVRTPEPAVTEETQTGIPGWVAFRKAGIIALPFGLLTALMFWQKKKMNINFQNQDRS